MARHGTWALVSDGVRARILRGLADGDGGEPLEIVHKAEAPHLRGVLADKTGASFASATRGRHAAPTPEPDPILCDMHDFARDILGRLEGHLQAGQLTRLAIFAAPGMLAVLRHEMPPALREAVFFWSDANLITLSADDLRDRLHDIITKERSP